MPGLPGRASSALRAASRSVGRGSALQKKRQSAQRWRAAKAFSRPRVSAAAAPARCSESKLRWPEAITRRERKDNSACLREPKSRDQPDVVQKIFDISQRPVHRPPAGSVFSPSRGCSSAMLAICLRVSPAARRRLTSRTLIGSRTRETGRAVVYGGDDEARRKRKLGGTTRRDFHFFPASISARRRV